MFVNSKFKNDLKLILKIKIIKKMNKFETLKSEALEMSRKSCCNFQHGCLIVKQGRIVSSACNDENGHAEYNAIKNLQRLLYNSQGFEERKER
jgi:pyrimidine deaminase RibD-like protein